MLEYRGTLIEKNHSPSEGTWYSATRPYAPGKRIMCASAETVVGCMRNVDWFKEGKGRKLDV